MIDDGEWVPGKVRSETVEGERNEKSRKSEWSQRVPIAVALARQFDCALKELPQMMRFASVILFCSLACLARPVPPLRFALFSPRKAQR